MYRKISFCIKNLRVAIVMLGIFQGLIFWIFWLAKRKIFSFTEPLNMNIIHLRPRSSDLSTYNQIFIRGDYNIKLPIEAKVILDLGANIGLFSLMMRSRFPQSKIISVEPDSENYEILLKNVGNIPDILTINAGIWHSDTKLTISDKYDLGKWAMVVDEDVLNGQICAISIDTIKRNYKLDFIDILKIDIETTEKILFSKNYEDWLPTVGTIIIELHDWLEVGCAYNFFKAISNSYDNYAFGLKGENVIISTRFVPSSEIV